MKHTIIFFTIIFCTFFTFAEKQEILAVLPLNGQGITDRGLAKISYYLRKEIEKSNKSITMNRKKMNRILFDKGLISRNNCNNLSCAQTMGHALSIDYVAQSRIAKVGEIIVFNLRVINISNQKLVMTTEEYIDGSVDALITNSIPTIAKRVVKSCMKESVKNSS